MAGRNENGQGTFIKLNNDKWQCKIQCTSKTEGGKRKVVSGTGKTKAEARRSAQVKLRLWEEARNGGTVPKEQKALETFESLMKNWIDMKAVQQQWASSTLVSRKNDMKLLYNLIGTLKLKEITTEIINNAFVKLLEKYNRQTIGMLYSLTDEFFVDMKTSFIISFNPFANAKPLPKKKRGKEYNQEEMDEANFDDAENQIFTEEEIEKLKDACIFIDMKGRPLYPRAPLFVIMLLTGMRGQELRALQIKDIDFVNHTITINKALAEAEENDTTKNRKTKMILKDAKTYSSVRTIGINAETEKYIKMAIENRPNKNSSLIAPTKNNTWVSRSNFAKYFRNLLADIGIEKKGRSPHNLRHSFVSYAVMQSDISPLKGKELIFISKYVGHTDFETTYRIYTHMQKKKLKEVEYFKEIELIEIEYK